MYNPPVYATPLNADLAPTQGAQAYVDGKAIGALMSFPAPTPISSGAGGPEATLVHLSVVDGEKHDADYDVVIFNQQPTAIANGDAWNPTTADVKKIGTVIKVRGSTSPSDWTDFPSRSIAVLPGLARAFRIKTPPTLWAVIIARSSVTFSGAGVLTAQLDGFIS